MQVFRCDRCGRIIEYGDRFLGRLNGWLTCATFVMTSFARTRHLLKDYTKNKLKY